MTCCDCNLLTDHDDFLDDLAAEAAERPPAQERNRA